MRFLLISFLLFGSVNAQTLQQQINYLRMEIYKLNQKVDSLQEVNKLCCCQNKMFYDIADGIFWYATGGEFWYENQDPASLHLDDRFPTEGVCNGAKAILVTQDATLFLIYIPEGDGWTIWMATKGGLNIAD